MQTSKLMINEQPLVLLPSLAVAVGLNEAIFLQQLHYWMQKQGKEIDGKLWIYNSYPEWQKQFPFWSVDTIKRTIRKLENQGLLFSANYNASELDRTKWYAINYEALDTLSNSAKTTDHEGKLPPPIPENNKKKEITTYVVTKKEKKPKGVVSVGDGEGLEGKTAKNSLVPCLAQELWQIAWDLDLSLEVVKLKHATILDMIEAGEFKHKTVYYTLRNWLRMGIDKGQYVTLDWMGKEALRDLNPERQKLREEGFRRMEAQLR